MPAKTSETYTNIRELLRYVKSGRSRVYQLRSRDDRSELWVVTSQGEKGITQRKLATLDESDDLEGFVEEMRKELRLGGWAEG